MPAAAGLVAVLVVMATLVMGMLVIATLFVITAEFDYPFRGDGQIQPFPFTQLHDIMAGASLNQAHGTR